jgi:hypothetical protein
MDHHFITFAARALHSAPSTLILKASFLLRSNSITCLDEKMDATSGANRFAPYGATDNSKEFHAFRWKFERTASLGTSGVWISDHGTVCYHEHQTPCVEALDLRGMLGETRIHTDGIDVESLQIIECREHAQFDDDESTPLFKSVIVVEHNREITDSEKTATTVRSSCCLVLLTPTY